MFCSECDKKIPNDSLFCPECGAKQTHSKINESAQMFSTDNNAAKQCSNCKCQIPSDSRFCPECGAKQAYYSPPHINRLKQKYSPQSTVKILTPEEQAKIKKRNKMIGIFVAVALASCFVIGVLSSLIKPTINLNKYLTVSFEGYDTIGKAKASFDTEKFKADYEKKLNISKKKIIKSMSIPTFGLDNLISPTDMFLSSCVDGSLDVTDGLSNGDTVTYIWKCDDELALSLYGYKLKYENTKFTVNGLKEVETFDPFEGIDVVFNGISPNASASISGSPTAKAAQNLKFNLDKSNGLSNGDTVTLTVSVLFGDVIKYCIENYQMIPSPIKKTYTVEGLDSYISSSSDISEESLRSMQNQAEQVFKKHVEEDWVESSKLLNFTYLGNYLLTAKDSNNSWIANNSIYLIYKAQVKNEYSNNGMTYDKTNEFYWFICFNNLLVDPSGATKVELTKYNTPSNRFVIDSGISEGWWSTKRWYYYGYQSLDDLYNAVVEYYSNFYNHEDNVDKSLAVTEIDTPNE
ncbi:MAG TPA: zinc ribbon domain-containing protein [Acetivibrio clariflavus]|nr:zinc ribbon domain-containing protein [Acetivibrio clariflavus]HPU41361.1 zinc ribbon domain-containing protein [Acetivibrio clariflavus]